MNNYIGLIYAFSAYLLWGIIPIFWKQLNTVPSLEIVAHRMVWACIIVVLLIISMRQWKVFRTVFRDRATMLRLAAASALITVNWAIFIWAVNNNQIVETSLGYFINPLISVLFGLIFFGESLRRGQIISLLIAAAGVAIMVVSLGGLPIISLSLAVTFSLYSVMKKKVSLPAAHGLAIETMITLLPALIYLSYLNYQGSGSFGSELSISVLLIMGGLLTLIPLLFFAAAAKRVSMTVLGLSQYIGPTCQLLIAVLIYKEPFGSTKFYAFGAIWLALVVYSVDQIGFQRKQRRARAIARA